MIEKIAKHLLTSDPPQYHYYEDVDGNDGDEEQQGRLRSASKTASAAASRPREVQPRSGLKAELLTQGK